MKIRLARRAREAALTLLGLIVAAAIITLIVGGTVYTGRKCIDAVEKLAPKIQEKQGVPAGEAREEMEESVKRYLCPDHGDTHTISNCPNVTVGPPVAQSGGSEENRKRQYQLFWSLHPNPLYVLEDGTRTTNWWPVVDIGGTNRLVNATQQEVIDLLFELTWYDVYGLNDNLPDDHPKKKSKKKSRRLVDGVEIDELNMPQQRFYHAVPAGD